MNKNGNDAVPLAIASVQEHNYIHVESHLHSYITNTLYKLFLFVQSF